MDFIKKNIYYENNKNNFKLYYKNNKNKILEYVKKQRELKKHFKNKIINLNCRDRYILFKLYEFIRSNNNKCYLQKHNIEYFSQNKERYIKYYEMIKQSNKEINNLNELMVLGNNNFNVNFCSKKKDINNCLKIQRGIFIVNFDL
jgi:hypothetical protein